LNLGLLISGNLGNIILQSVIADRDHQVNFVFTDFLSGPIINCCIEHNIPCFKGNPRNGRATEFLHALPSPDVIFSVNYLYIVQEDIINKSKLYSINIHGSLLPKYRGRTPHVWAIINNEASTGISAHLITEGCDEGDVIEQIEIPISYTYTGQDLLNIFNKEYPILFYRILKKISANQHLKLIPQDHSRATFFGKRTPEDGKINFDWQKERIYNWVRAQAKPYPGAFAVAGGNKVIIHKIGFTEVGFSYEMPNGLVLIRNNNTCVKTPNGVIMLIDFESDYEIKEGEILK
jgi:methionyl-tRNA formyltransferase